MGRFSVGRQVLPFMLAVIVVIAAGVWSPLRAQSDGDDAARFAAALASRSDGSRRAGPLSGELVYDHDEPFTTVGAGVDVQDFIAAATFPLPLGAFDDSAVYFDVGFTFRWFDQFYIDSSGEWTYAPFIADGAYGAPREPFSWDSNGDGAVTLELVVDGNRALLGADGAFVAAVELPPGGSADVEIGTGYNEFADLALGQVVPYADFQVWALSAEPEPAPTATPAPAGEASGAAATVSAEDAAGFAAFLSVHEDAMPLAGPFTANLRETAGLIALVWADVMVRDFHARATAVVPESASDAPWDIGILFGETSGGAMRIVVDARGQVFVSTGAAIPTVIGEGASLRTTPGEVNTIDLIVAGDRAFFGVNGELVAVAELGAGIEPADVAFGAAFYDDQTEVNRLLAFEEFAVLPLDAGAIGSSDRPGSPPDDPRQTFAALLVEMETAEPMAGPFSGRLIEAIEGTAPLAPAGVTLANFGATATIDNPDDAANGFWDSGFRFRDAAGVNHRLVVDSLGDVYAVLPGESPSVVANADSYDATPGGSNTLQLVVDGDRALFGINGELVVALDLPEPPAASDVQIGTGFFSEDFVVDRITDYRDFRVWEIG